jgi:hypothetical protein
MGAIVSPWLVPTVQRPVIATSLAAYGAGGTNRSTAAVPVPAGVATVTRPDVVPGATVVLRLVAVTLDTGASRLDPEDAHPTGTCDGGGRDLEDRGLRRRLARDRQDVADRIIGPDGGIVRADIDRRAQSIQSVMDMEHLGRRFRQWERPRGEAQDCREETHSQAMPRPHRAHARPGLDRLRIEPSEVGRT